MWLDRASNLGPLALESDVLPIVLWGPVMHEGNSHETPQK